VNKTFGFGGLESDSDYQNFCDLSAYAAVRFVEDIRRRLEASPELKDVPIESFRAEKGKKIDHVLTAKYTIDLCEAHAGSDNLISKVQELLEHYVKELEYKKAVRISFPKLVLNRNSYMLDFFIHGLVEVK